MSEKISQIGKLLEVTVVVLIFSIFVHLLTSASVCLWDIIVALTIVLITLVLAWKPLVSDWDSGRRLLAVLSALAGGFWVFNFFRYIGFVRWPLGNPTDLNDYLYLLYFHFVLSISVLAPVLIVRNEAKPVKPISWGNWRKTGFAFLDMTVLLLSSIGFWLFAFYVVLVIKISVSGPLTTFVFISILKAVLTGATEEICYRGIIQPAAIERFGVLMGIVFQSCLYTAFHMHLGAAFFSHTAFLAGVMTLGLAFGAITHLSGGIGWAFSVHTAINLVIEWHNLS
jgi:membrane protease YdiL (CAAX protease family)